MKTINKIKDNRGFSLVELIIVIAVMAVLVGIVGVSVIPYIDSAKKAKDIQIVSGYCTDAATAFASCTDQLDVTKTYTITITKSESSWTVVAKDNDNAENDILKDAFIEFNSLGTKKPNFQSKEGKKITKISIECKHMSLAAKLTVIGPEDPDAFTVEAK